MGSVFFELITRLNACKWFNRSILDTTNFMNKGI